MLFAPFQLRAADTHYLIQLLIWNYSKVRVDFGFRFAYVGRHHSILICLVILQLHQHFILNCYLVFQELYLVIFFSKDCFVHLDDILLGEAKHFLLGKYGGLLFDHCFFIRHVPVAVHKLRLGLDELELILTPCLLVVRLRLLRRLLPLTCLQLRLRYLHALVIHFVKQALKHRRLRLNNQ